MTGNPHGPQTWLPRECTESQGMAGGLGKGTWLGSLGGHLRTFPPFTSPPPVDHSGLFLYSLLLYRKGNRGLRGEHRSCPSSGARFHRAAFWVPLGRKRKQNARSPRSERTESAREAFRTREVLLCMKHTCGHFYEPLGYSRKEGTQEPGTPAGCEVYGGLGHQPASGQGRR